MTKRVCTTPGCPTLIDPGHTRCTDCSREQDRARGTKTERGYDADHIAARKRWAPLVATGYVKCRRCRLPINPDDGFDLGHPDRDCDAPTAPEHRTCNRATSRHRLST